MKRLTAVVTAVASAGLATAAIGIGMLPALAATHPASHVTVHKARHQVARAKAARQAPDPVRILSQYDRGQYASIVQCQGVKVPPPLHLRKAGTPLTLSGTKPSAAITRALAKRGPYKTVYTCTIVVKKKVPAKPVTVNTGFGGAAGSVSTHHPRTH